MKVLITRPRAQADDFAEKLRSAGFEPIFFPVIEIRPVDNNNELAKALENIQQYAWVVFTSVNAVPPTVSPHFLRKWGECPEGTRGVKIAAVGPKTAEALRKHGLEPDFIPDEYIGEAIMSGLGDVNGKWILLPRAELAREELPNAISKAGGIAHEIVVYKTLPAEIDVNELSALKSGVDVVTFTSASTVENFVAITRQHELDPLNLPNSPLIACIGPVTKQAAKEAGFQNLVVAKEYTTEGLIEAIANMEKL
ncbi:MAG: uroporphyrinogen-III synthase [Chloroflexi bacterium]|nr:MAG: uroporphyrinogen-III synthase [Chloroflexota bacterium]MCE7858365.1 uroporphyrinogen-III synthase [Chloroflexi bacterium CFX2]